MTKWGNKWEQYLSEEVVKKTKPPRSGEKYYGRDHRECFDGIYVEYEDFDEFRKITEDCLKEQGFQYLGEGASRVVYDFPEHDLVLKVIRGDNPEQEKVVNKGEAQNALQTKYQDIIPKVYDAADDFLWITVERVRVIRQWGGILKFFPHIQKYVVHKNWEKKWWLFGAMIATAMLLQKRPRDLEEYLASIHKKIQWELQRAYWDQEESRDDYMSPGYRPGAGKPMIDIKEMVEDIKKEKILQRMADMFLEFKGLEWDIRPDNVGYVLRNGKKQFKVLDVGIGMEDIARSDMNQSELNYDVF
jgi:hypothetical protein